jgi:hypothetical protein
VLIPQLPAPDSGKRGLGGAAAAAPRPARCCPPTPPAAGCRSRGRPDLGPSQVGPLFCVLALLLLLANRNSLQISEFRQWTLLLLLSETKKKNTADMVDFSDPKRRPRYLSKVVMVALLTAMCVVMLTQPPCHRRTPSVVSSTPTLLCLGSTSNCLN